MTDTAPPSVGIAAIAFDLAMSRIELAKKKAEFDELHSVAEQYEKRLFDAMENAGIEKVTTDMGTFSLNDLAWPTVEDPIAARAWADLYMPDAITLNRKRLEVPVREALRGERTFDEPGENGLPPGIGFTTSRKINWKRAT